MGGIRIINPGMLSLIQDLGRPGWSASGIPAGGAADPVSLIAGNRLVGNLDHAPGIEMTLLGGVYGFECDSRIAVTGAECEVALLEPSGVVREIQNWMPHEIPAGCSVKLSGMTAGARAYLCVAGGIAVPPVMGSASTYLTASFGGLEGRQLRAGDRLETGELLASRPPPINPGAIALARSAITSRTLRAVDGAQAAGFLAPDVFWKSTFAVSNRSDRLGVRLEGVAIGSPHGGRMTSEGMMWGAVEIPPDGSPIVLMADHPTTGGYPVIACVATVDLPLLGQLRPRDSVRFERISIGHARDLLRQREVLLQREPA